MVLLPENKGEALSLAMDMRAIGVDYLAIKPYTVAPQSDNGIAVEFDGDELIDLKWDLEDQESDTFKVIFRVDTIADMERDRVYDKCFAAPFWAYIDENGDIWGCYDYLGDDRFRYGNIGDDNNGWYGSGDEVRAAMDEACPTCRRGCRMDKANQYLWELLHPDPHVNFI